MLSVLLQRFLKYSLRGLLEVRKRMPIPLEKSELYFGYGANIHSDYLQESGLQVEWIGTGVLRDSRLEFTMPCEYHGVGYASVAYSSHSEVWGSLYRIDRWSLFLLDLMEWVPFGAYRRMKKQVVVGDQTAKVSDQKLGEVFDTQTEAWVYLAAHPRSGLRPPLEYLEWLVESGEKAGFPQGYLQSLREQSVINEFVLDHDFELLFQGRARVGARWFAPLYRVTDQWREWIADRI